MARSWFAAKASLPATMADGFTPAISARWIGKAACTTGAGRRTQLSHRKVSTFIQDVERVLSQFPEVRESAVVSVRNNGNEQVHAAVILKDPNANLDMVVRKANDKLEAHQR